MAGTIVADDIQHSTAGSVGTEYVVNGSAKQWGYFNGITNTINDSFNVSSLTDNSTGNYSLNFSNNMSNANYATSWAGTWNRQYARGDANTTSYSRGKNGNFSASGSDTDHAMHIVVGDLA
jgi:hypothetical protein